MSDTRRSSRRAERARRNEPPVDPARLEEDAALEEASRSFSQPMTPAEQQQFRSLYRGSTAGTGMLRERPSFRR